MNHYWIAMLTILASFSVMAEVEDETNHTGFVQVHVSLELEGIEQSIKETRTSLDEIGAALQTIANNENLAPDQQKQLNDTIQNINQLVVVSKESVSALPNALKNAKQTVGAQSLAFFADLKFNAIVILSLVGLIIIAIVVAVFWFLLRPLQHTVFVATGNISDMAKALKITAEAVEQSSLRQEKIAQQLAELAQNKSITVLPSKE